MYYYKMDKTAGETGNVYYYNKGVSVYTPLLFDM